jgi:pimeloyl-ACP methyl ester carboxylesterase
VAQQVALVRPAIVRRLILASSAPQGAAGMHGWAADVIGAVGRPHTSPDAYLKVFFTQSEPSRAAGQEALRRMYARTSDRDQVTTWETRDAQYDAVCTWGIPDHARLQRVRAIDVPVFIANGDCDPMIRPHYSYLLAGLIPQARVKIYPDSAHGFLFSTTPSSRPTSPPFSTVPTSSDRQGWRREGKSWADLISADGKLKLGAKVGANATRHPQMSGDSNRHLCS